MRRADFLVSAPKIIVSVGINRFNFNVFAREFKINFAVVNVRFTFLNVGKEIFGGFMPVGNVRAEKTLPILECLIEIQRVNLLFDG